ncbi:MAG: LysR family transcriptional regulator [Planctomycetes bacterium]|nr:LysR family transcriptional regulator [Planctomycetota bacterium]
MNSIHITAIDLNLLLVFDTLMAERSVTRTAERLGITQPAVSHALARLRNLLGDRLFVRTPKTMLPTPAAEALAPDIRAALQRIESVLSQRNDFSPATSARRFTLGLSDYASVVVLPRLLEVLKQESPNVSVVVKNTGHGIGHAQLDNGEVEVVVGNFSAPPAHLEETVLFKEDFVCAGRAGHPALKRSLTLNRYLSLEHIQVSTSGAPHGYVDRVLAAQHKERKVAVTVGHFLMAPLLAETTDLIATEPRRLLVPLAKQFSLAIHRPPFTIPTFNVTMAWHSRHSTEAAHAWFRSRVVKCLEEKSKGT